MGASPDGGDLTPLKGEAWKSTIRVRMLHGVARRRIIAKMAAAAKAVCPVTGQRPSITTAGCPIFAPDTVLAGFEGVPINQEELAATLASFAVAPLWCLERLGHTTTAQQREDFMAIWRHIGFYMGIQEDIILRNFSSYEVGRQFMASVMMDMIPPDLSNAPLPPTLAILRSFADRGPLSLTSSFEYRCNLTRFLTGDTLATALGLPEYTKTGYIRLRYQIFLSNYLCYFGNLYPRQGWNQTHIALMRETLPRLLRFTMGMKRTAFRPKAEEMGESGYNLDTEEKITPDLKKARELRNLWIWLGLEMGVVSLFLVGIFCVLVWVSAVGLIGAIGRVYEQTHEATGY